MNAGFAVLLLITGLITAAGIWSVNLRAEKWGAAGRWSALIGSLVLMGMFIYSLYYIKSVPYNFLASVCLAVAMTLAWLFACSMAVGLFIIIVAGIYWIVSAFRKTSCREMWAKLREDFRNDIVHIKAWIDGEE